MVPQNLQGPAVGVLSMVLTMTGVGDGYKLCSCSHPVLLHEVVSAPTGVLREPKSSVGHSDVVKDL